jgi:hypothetical protein
MAAGRAAYRGCSARGLIASTHGSPSASSKQRIERPADFIRHANTFLARCTQSRI